METKITHYEDEIKEEYIKLNDCKNYAELITKILLDYKGGSLPYGDPDSIDSSYYEELAKFLKKEESDGFNKYSYSPESGIIVVSCDDKPCLKLKSDQFCFSVNPFHKYKYPYGWLYKKIKDNKEIEEKKKKEIFGLIANCIYDTRTLGGGFLWPLDIYQYCNRARGGSSGSLDTPHEAQFYIEDRVDLTLLEIKHLFEWIEKDEQEKEGIWEEHAKDKNDVRSDIVFNKKFNEKLKDDKKSIEWLKHFGSFEGYIKFFCFEDFMEEGNPGGMPLDIVKSVLSPFEDGKSAKIPLKDPTEYKERGKHSIYRLSELEMMNMLKNVRILTLKRSEKMQKAVNQ